MILRPLYALTYGTTPVMLTAKDAAYCSPWHEQLPTPSECRTATAAIWMWPWRSTSWWLQTNFSCCACAAYASAACAKLSRCAALCLVSRSPLWSALYQLVMAPMVRELESRSKHMMQFTCSRALQSMQVCAGRFCWCYAGGNCGDYLGFR